MLAVSANHYKQLLLIFASLFIAFSSTAQSQFVEDPPVPRLPPPEDTDENIVRVALVDSGINYQLSAIRSALARTPSGQLIGYDYWDMDDRPFDAHPTHSGRIQRHGTQTASLLIREAPFIRLVPYRYPRPDMQRMTDLLAHASENRVRVIGLPLGGSRKQDWLAFESVAENYPDILFIASAGNNGRNIDEQPVYPASLTIANMLVVTSADDFVRPADGVNWGRSSVDYMVPAERQSVLRFDGSVGLVSGSSYAVPRAMGLAARIVRDDPTIDAAGVIKIIRSRFANGTAPRQIGQGYIYDPQYDPKISIEVLREYFWKASEHVMSAMQNNEKQQGLLSIPADVLVLAENWTDGAVLGVLDEAQAILSQCQTVLTDVAIRLVSAPDYLHDLETGASKTLMDAVRISGPNRRATIVFASDTRMNQTFDAEAFGKGNTRSRPWLTDSVWLTEALQDRSIALAHELFHIFANSGRHSDIAGNLMLGRTTGNNRNLTENQCESMRSNVLDSGLGYTN